MSSSEIPPQVVEAPGAMREIPPAHLERLQKHLGDRLLVDPNSRLEHGRDWWPISKVWALDGRTGAVPAAVAVPVNESEVEVVASICHDGKIPLTVSAGRSAVCGQAVPVGGGLVLDMTEMNRVIEIDDHSATVTVEAGIFGDRLEGELNGAGYTLGHFPQSIAISTVGGWIACRSAGQFSTRYGNIEEMLLGLRAVLARPAERGNRISVRPTPARATGIDINSLFLGSEGVLGIVTEATLRISPLPSAQIGRSVVFDSFEAGLEAIRKTLRRGAHPACMRLYDPAESARHFDTQSGAVLIAILEGEEGEVAWIDEVMGGCFAGAHDGNDEWVTHWFESRNDVSALDTALAAGLVVDTIEVAALWRDLAGVYSGVVEAVRALEGTLMASAHCSHAYTSGGCLYFTLVGAPGLDKRDRWYSMMWKSAMEAARSCGASISHHHGIGLVRAEAFEDEYGEVAMDALQALKDELDPAGVLNPGKMHLADRLGIGNAPWPPG